jgi:hypothetical protein
MQPRCLAHALARLSPAAATAASDEQMDADLEAAGIDMRPAYEQLRQMIEKAKMNALVDRFLQWPLPKSVRPEPGPFGPHDTGTCLLTADEAEQMLRYVLDVPAAEPRPAVERPAWAPADATHIHEEGDEVYRYNPESPRGYDYRTEKSPEWHKGYTRDRMTSDATLPLAPVAPAPPLAETGHDFTNSRGADLCDLCGQRRHAHAYPTLSAPAEPPPAPPATAGEGKRHNESGYPVWIEHHDDNDWLLIEGKRVLKQPFGLDIDKMVLRIHRAIDHERAAAATAALADAEKRGAEIEKAARTMMGNLKRIDDADGTWMLDRDKALPREHYANLDRLATALAQPVAGAREE